MLSIKSSLVLDALFRKVRSSEDVLRLEKDDEGREKQKVVTSE